MTSPGEDAKSTEKLYILRRAFPDFFLINNIYMYSENNSVSLIISLMYVVAFAQIYLTIKFIYLIVKFVAEILSEFYPLSIIHI